MMQLVSNKKLLNSKSEVAELHDVVTGQEKLIDELTEKMTYNSVGHMFQVGLIEAKCDVISKDLERILEKKMRQMEKIQQQKKSKEPNMNPNLLKGIYVRSQWWIFITWFGVSINMIRQIKCFILLLLHLGVQQNSGFAVIFGT